MGRCITNLAIGEEITYYGKKYIVVDLYPATAYLRNTITDEIICVGVGDLVVAGIEPTHGYSK